MLVIRTSVKPSSIQGIGLFAEEKVLKGSPVWIYDPDFDLFFDPEKVEKMNSLKKEFFSRYVALSPHVNKYILCADNSRFMNHSSQKYNVKNLLTDGEPEPRLVAVRDIEPGEEILVNYREIDAIDAQSDDEYLNL